MRLRIVHPVTGQPVKAVVLNSTMKGKEFVAGTVESNGHIYFYSYGDEIPNVPNSEGGFYDRPNFDVNKEQLVRHGD